ncbi:hypothetical protein Back11_32350 [Paenibacillus baekrokdamisoli]|uniref:Uncharacterized protein n=1 Tax=Paenibacillus baekrokdamisoli TaxID=1712516 RepID=A0A3G9ISQ9_9BACL|nr:hypothetical protein [Paenibacillus baekrokdamisoli]MBB3071599.1 hypothetical protein [Paenibacillus baekrokdamisoli]BBH21890.1 hypothetical protein Back11_32350 [Paenibacillus baekrokdamisoli]
MKVQTEEDAGRRRFLSGQFVPFDGMFKDIWGGCLPLLQGEFFPVHPDMGQSRWTYEGPLLFGLQGLYYRNKKQRRRG